MKLERLESQLNAKKVDLAQYKSELRIYEQQKQEHEALVSDRLRRKDELLKIQSLLVNTADTARDAGRKRMERVVTKALQSILGTDFSFEIEITESGGKPSARFLVCSVGEDGSVIKNEPQDSRGGGINDIIATALQVATLVIYNEPKLQGPIILDEPGKHISEEYDVKFGEFIEFISATFNRQIIMVTHKPHLAETADKTIVSQIIGGKTVLKEKKDGDLID